MKTDDWAVVEQALRNAKSMVTQDCDAQAMLDEALEAVGRLREDLALLRADLSWTRPGNGPSWRKRRWRR